MCVAVQFTRTQGRELPASDDAAAGGAATPGLHQLRRE